MENFTKALTEALFEDFDAVRSLLSSEQGRLMLPELWDLAELSRGSHGARHKNNFIHSITVVFQCQPSADLVTRLAALFHDVGKTATRKVYRDKVTFHGHEAVGIALTTSRLTELGFERSTVQAVALVVKSASYIQDYNDSWTDAAVRRVRREAGAQWQRSLTLAAADCTTRYDSIRRELHGRIDSAARRCELLRLEDERASERAVLSGNDLADLGVPRGPQMGRLLHWLLEENRAGRLLIPADAAVAVVARHAAAT